MKIMSFMEALTLEEERSGAIYLLDLLDRATPQDDSFASIKEAEQTGEEIDAIADAVKYNFAQYCEENGLEPTVEIYTDYVAQEALEFRRNRLLQTIDVYRALNQAVTYATNNPKHTVSEKFTAIATAEDVALLRQYIEYDIEACSKNINSEHITPDEKRFRIELAASGKEKLNSSFDTPTSQTAQTIDFSIDTLMAYAIGVSADELEFLTAVAVHSQNDQTSPRYLEQKRYLTGLIKHLNIMSHALVCDVSISTAKQKNTPKHH